MTAISRLWLALLALLAFATAAHAQSGPLSESDAENYRSAFSNVRRGEFGQALDRLNSVSDRTLVGQLQFDILFHRDYTATYEELAGWLNQYADLACAPRVWTLAMRRRPVDAPEPRVPPAILAARTYQAATGMGEMREREARHQLNDGNLERAWEVGQITGDWWVAGIAAYRLNRYDDALAAFERVAIDPAEDGWIRAGGAYWAARSVTHARRPHLAEPYLRLASRWPHTFYGQIAMRQLGLEPLILNAPWVQPTGGAVTIEPPAVDPSTAQALIAADARARRAAALAQVGRRDDALAELHAGALEAPTSEARLSWAVLGESLAYTLGLERATQIDAADFPLPELLPQGGFSLERDLVYAIARKESRFNAEAHSGAGAYGMMQVMPATAAELTGNAAFRRDPSLLFDPAINMRVGQNYIEYVMAMDPIQGDLLRAIVAYNGGPGPIYEARRMLGPDADSLLIIESIPVAQSRQYVEEVVAAYWIYQRLLGGSTATLDAVVAGASVVPAALDRSFESPTPIATETAAVDPAAPAPSVVPAQ